MDVPIAEEAPGARQDDRCYPLFGIVPIINTPFDDELRIDVRSLERHIEQSIADGIVGCIVPAVASEVEKLTLDERKALVEVVTSVAAGRIQVIAGASSDDVGECCLLADHALKAGCDGVLCRVPFGLSQDEDGIVAFFREVAGAGMDMLMIQDLAWGGQGMKLELIMDLFAAIPSFRCLKIETVPPGLKYTQVLDATKGRLHVSCGWGMTQMIEALDRGVHAFNSTAINTPFVRIYELHRGGRREEARALFERLVPALAWSHQHIDISIQFLKHYCHRRGLFATANVRQSVLQYDRYHERCGEEYLELVFALEDEIAATRTR
ncbi:MAG: dihydrodipicolinate synthetase [Chloroflexi bacterium]|nr:dihydrodipicolinate synthetase [Chloroflexota bacterium]